MKLFGKDLFSHKNKDAVVELYDFARHGLLRSGEGYADSYTVQYVEGSDTSKKKEAEKPKKTPKEVHELESLNDDKYELDCSDEYIDKNVKSLQKKMKLLPQKKREKRSGVTLYDEVVEPYGASKYGYDEMDSLIERLENRRVYNKYEKFFNQFPYTRSDLINDVIADNSNLRARRVEEFIPDLPEEAVDIMGEYVEKVGEITGGKRPVFYIIADKKDFENNDRRRDPILLVQSPFALSWQILGAWDEEMIFLGDL